MLNQLEYSIVPCREALPVQFMQLIEDCLYDLVFR